MTTDKLLRNIYYMALYHRDANHRRMNDLTRDDEQRRVDEARYDTYAYVVQMFEHVDMIGSADYKKTYNMTETFPTIN